MDAMHVDQLAKALANLSARRRLLYVLTLLPLIGGLASFLGAGEDAESRGRRRRRKKRHKHGKRRHRKHKKKRCTPKSRARTCAGKCGIVINNCKKRVDCGSCTCDPPCEVCFICNERSGACEPDPAQQGDACGEPGQVCQANGDCACSADPDTCPICTTCVQDGACVPVTDNTSCGPGERCCHGMCIFVEFDPLNCGSCGHRCEGGTSCENGVCCQRRTGVFDSCSAELPCCFPLVCRESDPLRGTCCAPSGTVTCFTNDPSHCCNTCIPFDPGCTGRCPGRCS
jgi:hypothetical protein